MRVYLAARYSRHPEMQAVARELRAMGHEVTSRWILGDHQMADHVSTEAEHAERMRFAQEDLTDLKGADCCLCFTEAPRTTTSRGGRHVELGIAIGAGKQIILVGPRENVFCCLPQVEQFDAWEDAAAQLLLLAAHERTERDGLYCRACGMPITQDARRRPVCPNHGRFVP
jgi:hypothetical protein